MTSIRLPTDAAIADAVGILQKGGLVAFPTETVYGLGANALDTNAVARIFAAKGRPPTNPLIVHVSSLEEVATVAFVAEPHTSLVHLLADKFWPGPLTLVLPKHRDVADNVSAGGSTVAVRVPGHPVALTLLRAAGLPLAAPSANRSEQLSPTLAAHVWDGLGDAVELILDGGACEVGLESTVLDLTEQPPRLLRPGAITVAELEAALGMTIAVGASSSAGVRSPGQMLRHYAPQTPLQLTVDIWRKAESVPNCAVIAHTLPASPPGPSLRAAAILRANPASYGAALYQTLHRMDSLKPDVILVEVVPDTDDWFAVRDRLQRAAA